MKHWIWALLVGLLSMQASAADSGVVSVVTDKSEPKVYPKLYHALEAHRLWVAFGQNTGSTLEQMKAVFADNYNKHNLKAIRTLVLRNDAVANELSNLDPTMLALYPFHVTIVWQAGKTRMLFALPSLQAQGSPAMPLVKCIEEQVIAAMQEAAGRQSADATTVERCVPHQPPGSDQ